MLVELHGAMTPWELVQVYVRVERLLSERTPVRARVRGADLAVLDALARMRLRAGRLGVVLEVTATDEGCTGLADLIGLTEVLQVAWQPESGEQRGVEEVVDVGDPSA